MNSVSAHGRCYEATEVLTPAVFKDGFDFALVSPLPGGSGEGPGCHFPKEIVLFGPIPARIRGETYFLFILALSAAGSGCGRFAARVPVGARSNLFLVLLTNVVAHVPPVNENAKNPSAASANTRSSDGGEADFPAGHPQSPILQID